MRQEKESQHANPAASHGRHATPSHAKPRQAKPSQATPKDIENEDPKQVEREHPKVVFGKVHTEAYQRHYTSGIPVPIPVLRSSARLVWASVPYREVRYVRYGLPYLPRFSERSVRCPYLYRWCRYEPPYRYRELRCVGTMSVAVPSIPVPYRTQPSILKMKAQIFPSNPRTLTTTAVVPEQRDSYERVARALLSPSTSTTQATRLLPSHN